MTYTIDIWLRGTDYATTHERTVALVPAAWTDVDVEGVLKDMLRALDREKNPGADERDVFLRGFSWIVTPSKHGGVVIAIEMQVGAVIGGPFEIDPKTLDEMIGRVMGRGGMKKEEWRM